MMTSTAPTSASVGPSCRSADRGSAMTTPTGTPSTITGPAGPPPRRICCGASLGSVPASGLVTRGPAARPRPPRKRTNDSGSAFSRARMSFTSASGGIAPCVATTRPSFMMATRGTRPSYSCRKNCWMSSVRVRAERLAQVTGDEPRHLGRRRPGRDLHSPDQIHKGGALQREHRREKEDEADRDAPVEALIPLTHRRTCIRRPTR